MSDASPPEGSPSIREQIAALQVGESYSRAHRLEFDGLTKDGLNKVLLNLRNTTQPAVWRAQKETGHQYIAETGDFRTRSRDIVVVSVVTRLA